MKILKRIFIDGLSGMAIGLFATLIIGTILEQAGTIIGGDIGNMIVMVASIAKVLTGAGIGIGVASKLGESTLVCASAASAGMIGAFASGLLNGSVSSSGKILLSGPGEPLGAFVAAYIGIEIGRIFIGRTKLDIILTPLTTIVCGGIVGLTVGPYISDLMKQIGEMIRWGTEQQPFLMGIVVSVLMGMALTLPISSAALGVILNLSGLAAGAATVGCCCNMVGFAVASYRENKVGGLLAQGIGTSMLQVPNIVKKPDLASGDYIECNPRTGGNNGTPYDEQCDRFRYGNGRISGTDHDMADDDPDRVCTNGADQDLADPDCASGSCDTWCFRIHEKERLDQDGRYEAGILKCYI